MHAVIQFKTRTTGFESSGALLGVVRVFVTGARRIQQTIQTRHQSIDSVTNGMRVALQSAVRDGKGN
jgi:hypothetical protein